MKQTNRPVNETWMERVLSNAEGVPSSKRLCGIIGFLVCQCVILLVAVSAVILKTLNVDTLEDMFTTDAWVSAALLGVECITGSISRSVNINKDASSNNKSDDSTEEETE